MARFARLERNLTPPNFVFRFAKCAAKKILFDLLLKISYTNNSKWKWYL